MNRALIAVLLALIIIAAGGFTYYWYQNQYDVNIPGVTDRPEETGQQEPRPLPEPGPIVSHAEYVTENTDSRLVLKLGQIADRLESYLPQETIKDIPGNMRRVIEEDFAGVLPAEIAFLGGADTANGEYELVFFVNQRYFATFLPAGIGLSKVMDRLPPMRWEDEEVPLRQVDKSVVKGTAYLPVPEEALAVLDENWATGTDNAPAPAITGDHLLEAAIDNRSGDLFTLWTAFSAANGIDYDVLARQPFFSPALQTLQDIAVVRLQADVADEDVLNIRLILEAVESPGPMLSSTLPMLLNGMGKQMINEQLTGLGIEFDGQAQWNAEAGALEASYQITGIMDVIDKQLGRDGEAQ